MNAISLTAEPIRRVARLGPAVRRVLLAVLLVPIAGLLCPPGVHADAAAGEHMNFAEWSWNADRARADTPDTVPSHAGEWCCGASALADDHARPTATGPSRALDPVQAPPRAEPLVAAEVPVRRPSPDPGMRIADAPALYLSTLRLRF